MGLTCADENIDLNQVKKMTPKNRKKELPTATLRNTVDNTTKILQNLNQNLGQIPVINRLTEWIGDKLLQVYSLMTINLENDRATQIRNGIADNKNAVGLMIGLLISILMAKKIAEKKRKERKELRPYVGQYAFQIGKSSENYIENLGLYRLDDAELYPHLDPHVYFYDDDYHFRFPLHEEYLSTNEDFLPKPVYIFIYGIVGPYTRNDGTSSYGIDRDVRIIGYGGKQTFDLIADIFRRDSAINPHISHTVVNRQRTCQNIRSNQNLAQIVLQIKDAIIQERQRNIQRNINWENDWEILL